MSGLHGNYTRLTRAHMRISKYGIYIHNMRREFWNPRGARAHIRYGIYINSVRRNILHPRGAHARSCAYQIMVSVYPSCAAKH